MGVDVNVEMWAGVIAFVLVPLLVLTGARAVAGRASPIARSAVASRTRRRLDACFIALGPVLSALVFVLAGFAVTLVTCWVLGKGAHAIQGGVDWPVWRWFASHQNQGWTDAWWKITNMGSPMVTQALAVVGGVVMAIVWRRRLWWLPPVALCLGYVAEKYGQIILKLVVDRGHPPHAAVKLGTVMQTHGTWPSGGCARVLIIYGLIVYFGARAYRNGSSRSAWVLGAALVSLALTVQAYARLNNLEHWITDVAGGIVYGLMLLGIMIAGAEIVQYGRKRAETRRAPSRSANGRTGPRAWVGSAAVTEVGARD
jgi:hypothetical protein